MIPLIVILSTVLALNDPWAIAGDDVAYDYLFVDSDTARFVHSVRSVDTAPTADEHLYLEKDNYAVNDSARVEIWDGNGFYADRRVYANEMGSYDRINVYEGESGKWMFFVEESLTTAATEVEQGINLWQGWNLVSFNIKDDPNPVNAYYVREIFGGPPLEPYGGGYPWFAYEYTETEGPDRVYEYRYGPESDVYFPRTNTGEPTWTWLWQMEWAYMIHLDEQHLLELSASDWYTTDPLTFQPSTVWDDSLDDQGLPGQYIESINYWFFLGFSKSRQVQVLPANEADGPFYSLYGLDPNPYTDNVLKVVKSDDGRVFLPNYNPQGSDYDGIGYLEPGRGYSLGFPRNDWIGDEPTHDPWPFCPGISEESVGDDGKNKGVSQKGISSLDPAAPSLTGHFQFKSRTQWWYPVMIDTFCIEGVVPEMGDEVAVFDGNLCVGASTYQGEFPLVIASWKDDIATLQEIDGYEVGNEMIFKFYDKSENVEITFVPPPGIQSVGDDPVAPRHSGFGAGLYALRSLAGAGSSVQQLPREYALRQNYPNPFNAETVIPLELPERSHVKIKLFNVRGQNLGTIYEGIQDAGFAKVRYRATSLASGVYFYKMSADGLERGGSFQAVGKMLVLK